MQDHHVLLAEYTLGLLDGQETSQAHALLGQDTEAVKTALNWENDLLELVDLLTPVHPSWQVLQRIQSDLGHQPAPAPSSLYRKPASDDTPVLGTQVSDSAEARGTVQAPARRASSADRDASSESLKRRPSVHTEPYFSAPPDLPPASEISDSASAGTDFRAIESPQTATAFPAPNAPSEPSAPAASTAVSAPSAPSPSASPAAFSTEPSPSAAADPLHIMGERDPRRAEQATREKPRNEKKKPSVPDEPQHGARSITGNIWVWRGATLVFGLIALVLASIPSTPAKPPVTVVEVAPTQAAILQAPGQSSTPGWIVTIDAQRNVLLSPQVRTDIPSDAAVQLWTRSKTVPQPRSLGLIDPNQPVTVPAALMGELSPDQLFEMTQEPAGGSPTASPSGPVLFIGRLVTFGKPAPVAPQEGAAAGAAGVTPSAGSR